MNKKFLSAILFGALMVTSTGTFVSCKDYDDDVTELWNAINGQKTDWTAKVTAVETSISNLQSAQTALEGKIAETKDAAEKAALEAQKAAIAAASAELATVKAELEASIAKLQDANEEEMTKIKAEVEKTVAAIAEANGKIAALQAFQSTTEETLKALADADATLAGTLNTLDAEVKANAVEIGKNKVAIEAQQTALAEYIKSNDAAVDANKAEIEKIQTELKKHQEVLDKLNAFDVKETQDAIAQLQKDVQKNAEEITTINNKLEVLSAAIYKGVTHVSLIAGHSTTEGAFNWNLELLSAEAVRTWTFGDKLTGAISFEKGARSTFTQNFLIRVSPTDAVISAENIKLINSQGADMEGMVSVSDVKPYTGLLTRGISANGLWEVSVEMNKEYDAEAFKAATQAKDDNGNYPEKPNYILYAVSLNTTLDAEKGAYSRNVVSEYSLTFVTDNKKPADELIFAVDKKNVENIANRYDVKADYKWSKGAQAEPIFKTDGDKTINVTADTSDDRDGTTEKAYAVTLNKPFTVALGKFEQSEFKASENIRGFYVTIDYDRAGDSDSSEKVAWKKYAETIKGLDTVTETGSIDLTITDADALTDYICFRVYAVNHDGSLVDPDGKAFEVVVGEAAEELASYNCTWTWKSALENEITLAPVAEDVFGDWVKNVAKANQPLEVPADTIILGEEKAKPAIKGLQYYDENKDEIVISSASDFRSKAKNIKYVSAVSNSAANATWYDNGKKYTQAFGFYNDRGQLLKTLTISLTKVMPSFPVSIKPYTGILQDGTLLKIYPKLDGDDDVVYDLDNVWHGISKETTFAQILADDEEATVTYVGRGDNGEDDFSDNEPALKAPKSILDPESETFETKFPMIVTYNYGEISDWVKDLEYNWIVEGTNFDVVFGNYVHDCTFAWGTKPVLTYPGATGVTQKIAVSNLKGKDWYGKAVQIYTESTVEPNFDAFNGYGEIEEADIEVITGNGEVNEFYTAKFVEPTYNDKDGKKVVDVPAHILLTSTSTASQGEPVETIIRLKVTDIYGYKIVLDLPAFTMNFTSVK